MYILIPIILFYIFYALIWLKDIKNGLKKVLVYRAKILTSKTANMKCCFK